MSIEPNEQKTAALTANRSDSACGWAPRESQRASVSTARAHPKRGNGNASSNSEKGELDASTPKNTAATLLVCRCTQCGAGIPLDRLAFRERLLEVVRELGSEAELERRAGLPVATLCHYTRQRASEPSRPYLVRIALAAGVSIGWLAAGIGPKRASD